MDVGWRRNGVLPLSRTEGRSCEGRDGIDAIGVGRGHRAVPARRRPDLVAAAPAQRDDAAHAERNPRTPLPRSAAPAPRGGARGRDYPGAPRADQPPGAAPRTT